MQNKWIHFLKPLTILPALIMLIMIFSFSSQTGEESANLSGGLVRTAVERLDSLFHLEMSETEMESFIEGLQHPVRKAAHVTEYFILALLVMLPLYAYQVKWHKLLLITFALCILFASSDELHQCFVAERGPSVKDVAIDGIGITAAVLLAGFRQKRQNAKC